jgi:hypothetical protein
MRGIGPGMSTVLISGWKIMAGIQNGKFSCPECGKKYTWKPMLAGKKARCGCGVIMTVPQPEASPPEDPDGLDLSLF